MAHTPLPWKQLGSLVYAPTGTICAMSEPRASNYVEYAPLQLGSPCAEEAYANADFIIRAVNSHDDMLAALKRTLSWLTSYPGGGTLGPDGPYEQVRAAIAKAESQGG